MTKKDFFQLMIKIFGLYSLIVSLFYFFPQSIQYSYLGLDLSYVALIVLSILLVIMIFTLLIKKTDWVIKILKLDKNFDDENIILGNLSSLKIFQIALIIIGGFLILDYLPYFIQDSYLLFKKNVANSGLTATEFSNFGNESGYFDWTIGVINITLGYLLITNNKRISKWLNTRTT